MAAQAKRWSYLFKDAVDKHPAVIISTMAAVAMMCLGAVKYVYQKRRGGVPNKFMNIYTVLRPDDPRIKKIRDYDPYKVFYNGK